MSDAESHAAEDAARREEAEVRNSADALVYQTERFLSDNADKIPEDAKSNVEEPLAELKKALEGSDLDAIKSGVEKVATASQALGAAMYQSGDAASAGTGDGSAATSGAATDDGTDDDIVDAEIVDDGDESASA
jgi:molecular chaperone DnaK